MYGFPGCVHQHSIKTYDETPANGGTSGDLHGGSGSIGVWLRGDNEEFGFHIQGNGMGKYRMRCRQCGRFSSDIPAKVITDWGLINAPFEWVDFMPRRVYPPCVVTGCTEEGRDMHHFAPRNTFGDDAERWPQLPVCRPHHLEWHQRMDGYRWRRSASQSAEEAEPRTGQRLAEIAGHLAAGAIG